MQGGSGGSRIALVRVNRQNGGMSHHTVPAPHEAHESTPGDVWAGMLAGVGAVLGFGAIFYKPLLLGTVAVILVVLGSLGNGEPTRIARVAFGVAIAGFTIGMLGAIFVTHASLF